MLKPCSAFALAAALAASTIVPASASEFWEEAGSGAVAILPKPVEAVAITGGSLFCAEQRWTLRLRAEREAQAMALGREARLAVDGEAIPVEAEQGWRDISIPLPFEALALLREGRRMTVEVSGAAERPSATFALANSRKVIDAVAPRCSAIDMSGYEAVALNGSGPAHDAALPLMAEEAGLFREATGGEPALAAALMQLDGGKRLLFASVCGSTRYYGDTGCTLRGHASEQGGEWRIVYESEGMLLFRDPNATVDGWPGLATVRSVNGVEPLKWSWTPEGYALQDPAVAEDTAIELRGSAN